jgi:ATP adenylyltransferase
MQLGINENLPALVAKRFTAAKDAGHLIFSQTHLAILHTGGIPVSAGRDARRTASLLCSVR